MTRIRKNSFATERNRAKLYRGILNSSLPDWYMYVCGPKIDSYVTDSSEAVASCWRNVIIKCIGRLPLNSVTLIPDRA